jgi:O-antigen/teichoic acid export membrane protein
MLSAIRRRLSGSDLTFIKGSMVIAIGFAVARVMGLGFSLVLGAVLPADTYGYIQYSIALSLVLNIGTMPFVQHVLARQISIHHADAERINRTYTTMTVLLIAITILTLVIAIPAFLVSGGVNAGAVVIFLGVTLFYSYYGLARGFEATGRLVAVFAGSNFIQLVAIIIVYVLLRDTSPLPALAIYGLSYLPMVLWLSRAYPFPVKFNASHYDRAIAGEVLRFSVPVWISQTVMALAFGAEIFLLQAHVPEAIVGAYAFTKTLGFVFEILPQGISTVIMPRVAKNQHNPRRLLLTSIAGVLAVSAAGLAIYLSLYEWVVRTFFGEDYLLAANVVILLAVMGIIFGIHGIVTNLLVGMNRAGIESANRILTTGSLYLAGFILIPQYGAWGAALSSLVSAIVAFGSLPLLLRLWKRRGAAPTTAQPS